MTDQELRDYTADHVSYELTMLHETAMRLKHEKAIDTDWILKNAFIESFTIHARALALFLYKGPKWQDDVTAEQYVKDIAAWKAARGKPSLRSFRRSSTAPARRSPTSRPGVALLAIRGRAGPSTSKGFRTYQNR